MAQGFEEYHVQRTTPDQVKGPLGLQRPAANQAGCAGKPVENGRKRLEMWYPPHTGVGDGEVDFPVIGSST